MNFTENYSAQVNPFPKLPEIDHNKLDANETLKWINAHPKDMQPHIAEIAQKVEHVSFHAFTNNLKDGFNQFNKMLKQDVVEDYMIMVEPGKSNQWMCELALPSLKVNPTQIHPLGKKGVNFQAYLHDQKRNKTPYYPSTLVFFDDGIYSGKQMSSYVKGVFDAITAFNREALNRNEDQIEYPKIHIIAPYATEFGEKMIYKVNEANSKNITLSCHERIKTLAEVLTPDTAAHLNATWWKDDPRNDKNEFTSAFQKGAESRGNIWFDHKVPNWLSFAFPLECGIVTDHDGKILNGTLVRNPENEPVFLKAPGKEYSPIPATIPPYKGVS